MENAEITAKKGPSSYSALLLPGSVYALEAIFKLFFITIYIIYIFTSEPTYTPYIQYVLNTTSKKSASENTLKHNATSYISHRVVVTQYVPRRNSQRDIIFQFSGLVARLLSPAYTIRARGWHGKANKKMCVFWCTCPSAFFARASRVPLFSRIISGLVA